MKFLKRCQNSCFRRLFNINILSGLAVALVAFLLMISSDYSSLGERKSWDAIYNTVIFGGLIYSAVFWYVNTFARDWLAERNKG
ncbi:MAG: hypothetical protein IME93_00335 [Proteobacteria bacterium]|nr:hypothetical protein [Pseudomonadota bacterium]